jgi:nitroimidazol reductase NimA-like FMN-containing flavoprotein (pyridoxamine 5'-phosphate oxidase superfamily)
MRRKDREIIDLNEIEAIINRSQVCRLAMTDGNVPYVVPLCFGYDKNKLYFHTGFKGKKIDILKQNPNVCFEFDIDCKVRPGDDACKWGMQYRSVIGHGKASFLESESSKRKALDVIMRQYGGDAENYPDAKIKITAVIEVDIEQMTGKASTEE